MELYSMLSQRVDPASVHEPRVFVYICYVLRGLTMSHDLHLAHHCYERDRLHIWVLREEQYYSLNCRSFVNVLTL